MKVLLIAKESLMSMIVKHALDLIYSYLLQNYRRDSLIKIEHELLEITRDSKEFGNKNRAGAVIDNQYIGEFVESLTREFGY